MITSNQQRIVIVLIFAYLSVTTPGAEPNGPPIALEFETESRSILVGFEEPPPVVPTHRADVEIWWYHTPPDTPNGVDLLKTPAGKSLSGLQRSIVETKPSFPVTRRGARHWRSNFGDFRWGVITHGVFAVGEEDARKMAQALVEFLTQEGKGSTLRAKKNHIEKLLGMQRRLKANIATVEEKAEAKNAEQDSADQKYMEAVAGSAYSLHPLNEVRVEVRKTIFEMEKMLDVLNIEIVGIQSKISAIKKYSAQSDVLSSQTLSLALREMAIRQEIELVGAESRRQATMSAKKREKGLHNLYWTFYNLGKEAGKLEFAVREDKKKLEKIEKELTVLGSAELPLKVEGNKVTIHPVKVN